LGAEGRELLLHMPMEPLGDHGPGPGDGAVEVGLSAQEIRSRVERALEVVRGVQGVNNHMGSRASADRPAMRAVKRDWTNSIWLGWTKVRKCDWASCSQV
jgi:polysaccharide deacetylase 2 family uncharacterized protein YibQ